MNTKVANLINELRPNMKATVAHQELSVGAATAVSIAALDVDTTHAMLSVDGAAVRIRFDGTAPVAATGLLIASGTSGFIWRKEMIEAAKLISVTGTAKLNVVELVQA